MSTRADDIGLRSLLLLAAMLASVLAVRYWKADAGRWLSSLAAAQSKDVPEAEERRAAAPQAPEAPRQTPQSLRGAAVVADAQGSIVPDRPIPLIQRLSVSPSKWSVPVQVPAGRRVGIRFSLGRIRVERDGVTAGVLFRNPTVVSARNGITLRPLASLDRTPRVFWFEEGVRVLRFVSLDEKRSEEVEVLWKP